MNEIFHVYEEAARFFSSNLDSPQARDYIEKRKLNDETVQKFRIGFAPSKGLEGRLLEHLKNMFDIDIIKKSGLIIDHDSMYEQNHKIEYAYFRQRLMLPLFDEDKIIGFGGRVIDDDILPKYIFRPLKLREGYLYGFNLALRKIMETGEVILTEGHFDVIMAHQEGLTNTVSSAPIILTKKHLSKLKGIVERVIICYDNDKSGNLMKKEAIGILSEEGISSRIVDLPTKDLDEFLKRYSIEDFYKLLDERPN